MLASHGDENDGANALDVHGRRVTELDGAAYVNVQVGEVLPAPSHVVCGTIVEEPTVDLVVAGTIAEEDVCTRLVEVEESHHGRCRWK